MARNTYDVDEKLEGQFNINYIKRLFMYMKPYKTRIITALIIVITTSVLSLLEPFIVRDAIDFKIADGDFNGLITLAVMLLAIIIVRIFCTKKSRLLMAHVGQSIVKNIRSDLFGHLQKLPFSYYESRPHGKILVRVVNYVNALSNLVTGGLINLITDLLNLIFIIVFMLIIDVRLTLVCLAGIPILIMATFIIKTAHRKSWQDVSRKQSNMNAYVHESIEGMKITQSFSREDENLKILDSLGNDFRKSWMSALKIQGLMGPIVDNISIYVICAVYIIGISMLDIITVGVLVAFISFLGRFWAPISQLSNIYNQLIIAMAYMERIFETMDEKISVINTPDAIDIPTIKGDVEFKDINFSYETGKQILNDINFRVNCGETVALVGPTGAGKTTIINLLSRFYNLDGGQVLIDGYDIGKVTLDSIRKQMGVMMQDSFLFSGTIMDNIRYGRLDATDDEVIEASKVVMAHDFIIRMNRGYKTEINERGSRLSAGQKQLISFARALLADPRILILDEATSSIDTETEMALQIGLDRLLEGRTSFVIAHRLSTIKNADKILYIDEGRVMEEGSHDELIAKRGPYYHLYTSQREMLRSV